jgi:ankyrin repeat protein
VTHGANVNVETVGGSNGNRLTPLIVASLNGDLEMVKFLISHSANVSQMAGVMTPINGAVQSGNEDVVKFLIAAGARPMFVDAEMADNEHHPAMAKLLRAADPVNQLLKRSADLKAEWNQLRQELAAFLLNAQQTGVLDKQKLAAYQSRLEELEKQMQAVVGEKQ